MSDSSSDAGDRKLVPTPADEATVLVRVRYCETDAMGVVHHANYLNWLEIARTELFRTSGGDYRGMERRGFLLVVVSVDVNYKRPARYDDVVEVRCRLVRQSAAKLVHSYEIRRCDELLATASTTLACVDRAGTVRRITDDVLYGAASADGGGDSAAE